MSKNIQNPTVDGIKKTTKVTKSNKMTKGVKSPVENIAKKAVKRRITDINMEPKVEETKLSQEETTQLTNLMQSMTRKNNALSFRIMAIWVSTLLLTLTAFSLASALVISLI